MSLTILYKIRVYTNKKAKTNNLTWFCWRLLLYSRTFLAWQFTVVWTRVISGGFMQVIIFNCITYSSLLPMWYSCAIYAVRRISRIRFRKHLPYPMTLCTFLLALSGCHTESLLFLLIHATQSLFFYHLIWLLFCALIRSI